MATNQLQPNINTLPRKEEVLTNCAYIPRAITQDISSLLSSTPHGYTVIVGEEGVGKTTVLSNLCKEEKTRSTFIHFFGASALNSCLHVMLLRLYEDINGKLGEDEKIKILSSASIIEALPNALETISKKGGLVILLDAIDQLEQEYQDLQWLPSNLPPHIHIIISSTPKPNILTAMDKLKPHILNLPPLQTQEKREVITQRLGWYGKSISKQDIENLVLHKLSNNLLFLTTVIDDFCTSPSPLSTSLFVEYEACIDMCDIFRTLLAKWEQIYGRQQTQKVAVLLSNTRAGIEESTIQQLTKGELILNAVRPLATITNEKLNFAHNYFKQATYQKYERTQIAAIEKELVKHWKSEPFTPHVACELPWLISEILQREPTNTALQKELVDILLDFNNFSVFNTQKYLQHDIVQYWNTLAKLDPIKWTHQQFIPAIRKYYKKAFQPNENKTTNNNNNENTTKNHNKNNNQIPEHAESIQKGLQSFAEWLTFAGSKPHLGLQTHVLKQIERIRVQAAQHFKPRPKCYMCLDRSPQAFETDSQGLTLCIACIKKNKEKMDQWDKTTNLEECVALVTGARIKIGYYTALRLLRCGVTVIAVTRFPHDAALRYSRESDFDLWKHKLHIYGLDLRYLPSVNQFISHVLQRYRRIDMLINNAAQTKRRPRAYYHEVVTRERRLMGGELENTFLIKNCSSDPFLIDFPTTHSEGSERNSKRARIDPDPDITPLRKLETAVVPVMDVDHRALDPSLPLSAALTQVPLHSMDAKERDDELFPPGLVDEHNEPLDMRPSTTWDQQIDEVSPIEMLEVQVVNATVPFMFVSSFKPLLKRAAEISHHKRAFIVNVSAVEGLFYYNKQNGTHPHTNMAKAALNMMTKSISEPFSQLNIFVTSVDTGWCTEMRFVPMDERDPKGPPIHSVPLTDKDGAARVLHPIFVGLSSPETPPYGVLYHDFEVVDWE